MIIKKYLLWGLLLACGLIESEKAFGQITLFSTSFNGSPWTTTNYCTGSNQSTFDVANGIYFYSKSSTAKPFVIDIAAGTMTWCNNNISTTNYYIAIPLTNVNGSITVTITSTDAVPKLNDYIKAGSNPTAGTDPTNIGTTRAGASNTLTFTESSLTGSNQILYLGRYSSSYTKVSSITITTPAPANTSPTFLTASPTLTLCQNSSATDIKSLLHISDVDASQTETWSQSSAPSHGTLTISSATASSGLTDITPGGTMAYTPTSGYSGSDAFTIQVSDGTATATKTVNVIVNAAASITTQPVAATYNQNDAPTALSVSASNATGLQWYSNTSQSTSGATLLVGQTASTYTPQTTSAGTTWYYCVASGCSDVTSNIVSVVVNAITILSAPTVSDATDRTNQGFTANWSNIANSSSYTVNVYDGSNTKVKTITGISATNTVISGLLANTTYTYKVIAVGNGSTYGNSVESTASTAVRTLSTDKAITAFTITGQVSSNINESAKTIAVYMPAGTDRSSLTTNLITLSNYASVSPLQGVSQDFTSSITYTVTAEDGSTQNYTVSVTYATSATDYFRSISTGNWNDNTIWQSSADNGATAWINATSAPTSSSQGVSVTGGYTVTVNAATTIPTTTVASGSTLKATAQITLGSTLSVLGTYEHAMNGGSIPLSTWVDGSTCLITGATSTAPGNGTQNFYNFTWNCSGQSANLNLTWGVSAKTTINGSFTLTNSGGSEFRLTNSSIANDIEIKKDFVLNNSAANFKISGSSTPSKINVIVDGNINITGGTLAISGNSTANFSWNVYGDVSVSNATLTKSSGETVSKLLFAKNGTQNLTIANTGVTISSGFPIEVTSGSILNMGASVFNGSGAFNLDAGATLATSLATGVNGNITTTGTKTFDPAANYLFNGSSAQVTGTFLATANNIEINNSTGITLSNTSTSASNLIISSGATLNIPGGKQLTATTSFTNNGTINLLSDGNGTATLLTPATITGSGTATVNQAINYRTWYTSSPVTAAILTGMDRVKSYNEYDNTWPLLSGNMLPGTGYLAVPASTGITGTAYTGTLNNGDIPVSLTTSPATNSASSGFNLVGNPYPSYLDWRLIAADGTNSSQLATSTMWYRTKVNGNYTFWTVNGSGVGSPSEASYLIPPMQAFWVQGAGTLTFKNSMRSHNTTSSPVLMKAPTANNPDNQLVRLQVSNGTNTDETVLYFNINAANGFDSYDSPKKSNENDGIPELYTVVDNKQLVINGMSSIPLDKEILLGLVPGNATSLSIQATELTNLPLDVKVLLVDKVSGSSLDLTGGTAQVLPDLSSASNQYSIVFRSAGVVSALENAENKANTLVYRNANNQIVINLLDKTGSSNSVAVYNALGQKMLNQPLLSTVTVIGTRLTSGVYFVKTTVDKKDSIQKVVLN